MNPHIPAQANKWLSDQMGQPTMQRFPLNLAAENLLPPEILKDIFRFVQEHYIWPQVQERMVFEPLWDKLLKLARINLDDVDLNFPADSPAGKEQADSPRSTAKVSDSVIFDAIDRLTNINHFISFKDGLPMQFIAPEFVEQPYETDVYNPLGIKVKAGNAILRWNANNVDYYRKHLICARHHYTYGISFATSEFEFQVEEMVRQNNQGQIIRRPEITKVGATFEPLSIRRLWLDYRLPAWDLDSQPCPFYFQEVPWFAMLQNQYNPDTNPFGYVNLDRLDPKAFNSIYSEPEFDSIRKAMQDALNASKQTLPQILCPEYSMHARWMFYPMIPLDPETGEWKTRQDGSPVPMRRFVLNTYGSNLVTHQQILRLQAFYYPKGKLPIFGSSHMPDLDSGLYTQAIGQVLFNHYKELVTCTNQYIENKEWINNPPTWVQQSSPAQDEDLTRKGAKLKVNGPMDLGWRQPYDATASTAAVRQMLRDEAQTTSKAVDAILGKAMGGRTSATEASNAYQTSMSGITTDINLFNYDISGGFARRVWWYCSLWMDPDLLYAITGSFVVAVKPEELWIELSLKTNVGSSYIDSIVRQQNLRYIAESTRGEPMVRRDKVFQMLFEEMKIPNAKQLVIDGGYERQVSIATLQAQQTYMGEQVFVSPDQDHAIAMRVKMNFIEDRDSVWNSEHPEMVPALMQQIQVHQAFLMMQLEMQSQQQAANAAVGGDPNAGGGGGLQGSATGIPPTIQQGGQPAQQNGGAV